MHVQTSTAGLRQLGFGSGTKRLPRRAATKPASIVADRYSRAGRLAILLCASLGSWGMVLGLIDALR